LSARAWIAIEDAKDSVVTKVSAARFEYLAKQREISTDLSKSSMEMWMKQISRKGKMSWMSLLRFRPRLR
jgi:predicted DNA binding CopG/RHH family protein